MPCVVTRFASTVAVIAAIGAIGLTVSIALFVPVLNWDLLAYVGVVKSWSLHSAPAIQAAAYGDVHRFAVTHGFRQAWQALISPAIPYRHEVATDPVAFVKQLPFYRIRPLYLLLLWLLSQATASVSAAAVAVSAGSLLMSALVLSMFAGRRLGSVAAAVWPAMFCLSPIVIGAARLQTPDALATCMVLTAAVLFLGGRELAAALVLLAAVLVRTDLMLLGRSRSARSVACTTGGRGGGCAAAPLAYCWVRRCWSSRSPAGATAMATSRCSNSPSSIARRIRRWRRRRRFHCRCSLDFSGGGAWWRSRRGNSPW